LTTNQPSGLLPPNFLFICTGPSCGERGGTALARRIKQLLVDQGRWGPERVVPVQCFGECPSGPNACSSRHPELLISQDPEQADACLARLCVSVHSPESGGAGGATT